MISDYFILSLNNLRRRRLRSWLTLIGIFIGIAAVVSLISLGQGLQSAVTAQFSSLSVDKLVVQNAGTGFGPPGSTVVDKLNSHDVDVIERVHGASEVIPRLLRVVETRYNGRSSFTYITSIPENSRQQDILYQGGDLRVEEGRLLKSGDRGKIFVGSNIAKGEAFDKDIVVGKDLVIEGETFEVVGILKPAQSFQINDVIFMYESELENLLDIEDEIDLIIVHVDTPSIIERVGKDIERALRRDRNLDEGEEDFSVQTPLQTLDTVNDVLNSVNLVVVGIAMISLIVGGIGIANTMYTSVLERKKEIGTMKAVGAQNKDILLIFIMESGLLGLVGGLIGVALGIGIAYGVAAGANAVFGSTIITVSISIPFVISIVLFGFLVGLISGLVPSVQASRLKPVEALRG